MERTAIVTATTLKTRARKLPRVLLALALMLGLLYFVGPWIAVPILRHKLDAMVAKNLNARLTMDGLSYDFPYGLRARNAALIAKDEKGQDIDLLRVKRLELV